MQQGIKIFIKLRSMNEVTDHSGWVNGCGRMDVDVAYHFWRFTLQESVSVPLLTIQLKIVPVSINSRTSSFQLRPPSGSGVDVRPGGSSKRHQNVLLELNCFFSRKTVSVLVALTAHEKIFNNFASMKILSDCL